jgi:hypothetical protein
VNTTTVKTETARQSIDMNVEVYISSEKVLVRINKFDYIYSYNYSYTYTDKLDSSNNKTETKQESGADNEYYEVFDKMVGKWLDCTKLTEAASALFNVDSENVDVLTKIGTVLSEQINNPDTKYLTKNDSVYTFTDEGVAKFLGTSSSNLKDYYTASITLDLSNSIRPAMICDYKYNYSNSANSDSNNTSKSERTLTIYDELYLENVNNTRINLKNVNAIDIVELMDELENDDEDD